MVKPTFLLAISPIVKTEDILRGIIYIVVSKSSLTKKGFVVTTQEQQLLYRNKEYVFYITLGVIKTRPGGLVVPDPYG